MSDPLASSHRPSRRLRWAAGIGVALLIPCALVAHEVYWACTAEAVPTVDYRAEFRALIERSQPSGSDGMPAVARAAEICLAWEDDPTASHNGGLIDSPDDSSDSGDSPDLARVTRGPFDRARLAPELRAMAELEARGLDKAMREAARADRFMPELKTDPQAAVQSGTALHNLELMNVSSLNVRRYAAARMRERAVAGDAAGARLGLASALATEEAAGACPLLIQFLISSHYHLVALREVRDQLASEECSAATIEAYTQEIDHRTHRSPSLHAAFEGERLFMLDGSQYIYAPNGRFIRSEFARLHGFDALTETSWDTIGSAATTLDWSDNLSWWKLPRRAESDRETNDLIDQLAADAERPRAARTFDFDRWGLRLHPSSRRHWESSKHSYEFAFDRHDEIACSCGATRIMLAVERYLAATGEYPPSLASLVPQYLDAVPQDPFAPDGKFRYRLGRAAAEQAAMDYTLYSVGPDGLDDSLAGELDENGVGADVLYSVARQAPEE